MFTTRASQRNTPNNTTIQACKPPPPNERVEEN
jgi:hypothetical protein